MKPSDLNLWSTETDDKVQEKLYEYYPTQRPHPVWKDVSVGVSKGDGGWTLVKKYLICLTLMSTVPLFQQTMEDYTD